MNLKPQTFALIGLLVVDTEVVGLDSTPSPYRERVLYL